MTSAPYALRLPVAEAFRLPDTLAEALALRKNTGASIRAMEKAQARKPDAFRAEVIADRLQQRDALDLALSDIDMTARARLLSNIKRTQWIVVKYARNLRALEAQLKASEESYRI